MHKGKILCAQPLKKAAAVPQHTRAHARAQPHAHRRARGRGVARAHRRVAAQARVRIAAHPHPHHQPSRRVGGDAGRGELLGLGGLKRLLEVYPDLSVAILLHTRLRRRAAKAELRASAKLALHGQVLALLRVPTVLHRVLRATRERARDLRPSVTHNSLQRDKQLVFLLGPRLLGKARIEVVLPPLAHLLTQPPRQMHRHRRPLDVRRTAHTRHLLAHDFVLLLGPLTLLEAWFEHLLPTVEALNVRPQAIEGGVADPLPILGSILRHSLP
mmetsp:Transcript_25152/g.52050  ORF Transcript_25152/g.52050 Transcript_25152/m.52050 type:complete len:272 (-) Transcript_25152:513-1328(-)